MKFPSTSYSDYEFAKKKTAIFLFSDCSNLFRPELVTENQYPRKFCETQKSKVRENGKFF